MNGTQSVMTSSMMEQLQQPVDKWDTAVMIIIAKERSEGMHPNLLLYCVAITYYN